MENTNDKKYCVYAHINKVNGKIYIGQTCIGVEQRWGNNGGGYLTKKKDGKYCQPLFAYAILKYGWDNFDHIVFQDNLSQEESNQLEQTLINFYDTTNCNKGYNIREGGGNGKLSEETKHKISESLKGENSPWYGKHLSKETRKKISQSRMGKYCGEENPFYGRRHTEETKKKLSQINKGKPSWNKGKKHTEEAKQKMRENHADFRGEKSPLYGTHLSNETKERISKANKGRFVGEKSPFAKKVNQYDLCGNLIKRWNCIKDVENELHINHASISACCKGKRNKAGGFIWRYADDVNSEEVAV